MSITLSFLQKKKLIKRHNLVKAGHKQRFAFSNFRMLCLPEKTTPNVNKPT